MKERYKNFRNRMIEGETLLGSWIQTSSPTVAGLVARQGFDWIAVDVEHGESDLNNIPGLMEVIASHGCFPMVRLPSSDAIWIRRCLDAGAKGLIIPTVNSVEQAQYIIQNAKYPPVGSRGFGFSAANGYGQSFSDYTSRANEETVIIVQIEHVDAVKKAEQIAAIEGVDGLMIGPYDLSGSMGLVGKPSHPEVIKCARKVLDACVKTGKSPGFHVVNLDPVEASTRIHEGYRFVALGIDTLFIREGSKAILEGVRERLLK